ncbi:MAG: YihY/virulence factor BrkB family protein [Anaerolineae bacterium]|nr:YihY/virulence factor BrkB family protein [Anaerolineae bacterium]
MKINIKSIAVEIFHLLKQTFDEWNEDKAPRLAAALSYYTAFSLAPLLVIVIAVAGAFFSAESVREQVLTQVSSTVSPETADLVNGMIDSASQPREGAVATVISIGTLLLGAAGAFGQLQGALDTIWDVDKRPRRSGIVGLIRDNLLNFGMVLLIGFLLLISLVLNAVIAGVSNSVAGIIGNTELVLGVINFALSFAVTALLFAAMFKVLPHAEIAWRDVWVGAIFTTILFSIGRFILGRYLGGGGAASPYGVAGAFVLILLWIYYSAQILFFGAEFTQVYSKRYGTRKAAAPVKTDSTMRTPEAGAIVPYAFGAAIVPYISPKPRRASNFISALVFGAGIMIAAMAASIFGGRRDQADSH